MLVKSAIFTLLFSLSYCVIAEEVITPESLEYCTVCHGSQLKGNVNIGAPRLTGLSEWYIERQLKKFKSGTRGAHSDDATGGEMMNMVSNLSDQQLTDIAKWVTKTDSAKPASSIHADAQAGKTLYQTCAACHGPQALGNKTLGAPKLSSLNDWYIVTQLNHFRLGLRGTEVNDTYGQQMRTASGVVASEQDAANVAAYIQQLK